MRPGPRVPKLLAALAAGALGGCVGVPRIPLDSPPDGPPTAPEVVTADFAAAREPAVVAAAVLGIPPRPPAESPPALDLPALQRMAVENSPALRQAAADVAAARGAAVQAGLHPNPTVGYQGDQIGSGHTAGQQGVFLSQTIVTRGKLGLAQAAALAEVTRTELAHQQAAADVRAQVRVRYFAFATAAEAVRITEGMARTAEALAERQRGLLASKQVAPHEVDQARALAAAARGDVVQARNRQTAAWKQLAAAVGNTDLPLAPAGATDAPLPAYAFDTLRQRVLEGHTEVRSAAAQVERAGFQLELARVTPYPNLETNTYVQRDYQTRTAQFGLQVGVALPVFDRNQGNIAQAEANYLRATHEAARVRQDLSQRLTEAFERYATNRALLEQYRAEILPHQVKAFDGLRQRFEQEFGRVSFSEVVLAQQTLANTYAGYLRVLSAAWEAAAELGRLAQTDEPTGPGDRPDSWPDPRAAAGSP